MGASNSKNIRTLAEPKQTVLFTPDSLLFDTIDSGTHSGIEEALTEAYHTAESFHSLWEKHTSGSFPPPKFPDIDFDSSMVLSAFRGMVNTGGYGIEITSVENLESEIVVSCLTTDPDPWAFTPSVISEPFHIVNITASDKPVRYDIKQAAPPERPFPTFMLLFEDDADRDAIMETIEKSDNVDSVILLNGIDIGLVYFYSGQISEHVALNYLEAIEGVRFVETDPP